MGTLLRPGSHHLRSRCGDAFSKRWRNPRATLPSGYRRSVDRGFGSGCSDCRGSAAPHGRMCDHLEEGAGRDQVRWNGPSVLAIGSPAERSPLGTFVNTGGWHRALLRAQNRPFSSHTWSYVGWMETIGVEVAESWDESPTRLLQIAPPDRDDRGSSGREEGGDRPRWFVRGRRVPRCDDLAGSTLTINNPSPFGSHMSAPMAVPPISII